MWCAQQQPVAVNPGIDGTDLADLEAHAATRVPRRVRALSQHTAKRLGSTGSQRHRLASCQASLFSFQMLPPPPPSGAASKGTRAIWTKPEGGYAGGIPAGHRPPVQIGGETRGRNWQTVTVTAFFSLEVSRLSTGATLHWSPHTAAPFTPLAAKDKGQRPAQLSYQSALSTSPCRCWDQCACRPPSPSSGRCRSVGGRAGCAAQAWRWQVRWQAQSMRPGGACDKGGGGSRDEPVAGTCGWRSAPTRGSAARPRHATPSR